MLDWDQDIAFDKLKEKRSLIEGCIGSNEATTRLRAIDTILFDVLGWDKSNVLPEKYVRDVGFADYALFQQSTLCLILEAKREGTTYVLPESTIPDRPIGFGFLASQCKDASDAMRQATGYAAGNWLCSGRGCSLRGNFEWLSVDLFTRLRVEPTYRGTICLMFPGH